MEQGAADNEDTFIFEQGGSIQGTADGGAGGFDTIEVTGGTVVSTPTGQQSGILLVDGVRIAYAGLEPVAINAAIVIINGRDVSGVNHTLSEAENNDELHVGTCPTSSGFPGCSRLRSRQRLRQELRARRTV